MKKHWNFALPLSLAIVLLSSAALTQSQTPTDESKTKKSLLQRTAQHPFQARLLAASIRAGKKGASTRSNNRSWFDSLTPTINGLSRLGILGREGWLENEYTNAENIIVHEGRHKLNNTRYKEWWYFDVHTDNGYVISTAIVLSIVKPHYFLWVYDPTTGEVLEELMRDGDIQVNDWGTEGLDLAAEGLRIKGRADTGYHFEFTGKTMSGDLVLTDPIEGRFENHVGINHTFYGLYQVPKFATKGHMHVLATGERIDATGQAYHDHWWGVMNRYTKWAWLQVKFDNGWVAGFYRGKYGYNADDLHLYAWLYRPGIGYTYFDENTMTFEKTSEDEWTASVEGAEGRIQVSATQRAQRYEFKPVKLFGISLGEVDYYQYPIISTASFTDSEGSRTDLTSEHGILEWDWDALW